MAFCKISDGFNNPDNLLMGHRMAQAAEHALADARHRLNRFFNGRSPERFAFTLNPAPQPSRRTLDWTSLAGRPATSTPPPGCSDLEPLRV